MSELFRLISMRPPQAADASKAVSVAATTSLQQDLAVARTASRERMEALAVKYRRNPSEIGFITEQFPLHFQSQLLELHDTVAKAQDSPNLHSLQQHVKDILGLDASALANSQFFSSDLNRASDSLIALMLAPDGVMERNLRDSQTYSKPGLNQGALARIARVTALIQRAAANDQSLNEAGATQAALSRTILLPDLIFPLPVSTVADTASGFDPKVQPIGIGDLLVIKQNLKRYEAGEIAHIENVLIGESKTRTTKRTTTTDQTITAETETTTETEKDLQSTERFELKREVDQTLKEDLNVKAGVAATYRYGTMLEVKAHADVDYTKVTDEAQKVASDYSKDVTTRAASKVTERVRQQQTIRTIETFEETNEHGLNNVGNHEHVVGIYQWVDKIYEAQVYNYGKRLLFDVMVPEPGAFLLDAMAQPSASDGLAKPAPPTINTPIINPGGTKYLNRPLKPTDLNPDKTDYLEYVSKYNPEGVTSPPVPEIVLSKAYSKTGSKGSKKDDQGNYEDADLNDTFTDFTITSGYVAQSADVEMVRERKDTFRNEGWGEGITVLIDNQLVHISMQDPTEQNYVDPKTTQGKETVYLQNSRHLKLPVSDVDDPTKFWPISGSLSIAVLTVGIYDYAMTVTVYCTRTDAAVKDWQLKTYNAIMAGYDKLLRDYNDKLAEQATQQGVQIQGRPTEQNRQLERIELKKACIMLLTGQQDFFDHFDAVSVEKPNDAQKYPAPDVSKAEDQGKLIRFFEQAFEWDQMMYFLYPYYYGRKSHWYEWVLKDDTDPKFADFIKAGAARVVFPVRLNFENAVHYYLNNKTLPPGDLACEPDDLDNDITSCTYLPIWKEIKESQGGNMDEPWDDPWDVKLSTELVILRNEKDLPTWKKVKDNNGHEIWVPPDWKDDGHGNWGPT